MVVPVFITDLVSDTSGHLWGATLGDRLYKIFVRAVKNSPPDKNRGHSLTDCVCYLNSDAQTPSPFGAAQVMLHNLGGGRGGGHSTPLAPSHSHRLKGKAVTKRWGGQRDSAHFSAVSVQVCESLSTEDFKYF